MKTIQLLRLISIINSLLIIPACSAQNPSESLLEDVLEDLSVNNGTDNSVNTPDWENELEELSNRMQEPVNLNVATREQLEQFSFLSDIQIEHLLAYIYIHGQMKTIYELQLVEEMDKQTIQYLLPFVCIKAINNKPAFRCTVVEKMDSDARKQFLKEDITSIEFAIDFGGNKSGHAFVARGYTDDYRDVIVLASRRIMAKDETEDIDSNMLDKLFCDFIQDVIDKYAAIIKHGDYIEYCNAETAYWDNAETVLGNSIRNAVEKRFPWMSVKPARKKPINDRIHCTIRLMGAGRFWMTEDCGSLQAAFTDAVWNQEKDKDERLDDGSTDIDSLDAFEYTIERDMKYLIQEVDDV